MAKRRRKKAEQARGGQGQTGHQDQISSDGEGGEHHVRRKARRGAKTRARSGEAIARGNWRVQLRRRR